MSDETERAELPPDRLTALWRRLKDHRIAQWTVGYVAVAYGIQHAVTLTSEAYKWPDQIMRISMTLLALVLPLAMVFAWYHGERTTRRISAGEMSIVSVMLVGISLIFYLFVRPANQAVPAAQLTSFAAPAAANGISLAVLPFVNLSSDKDQEFFSDGITEEITAALAQVKGLHVVGRTSAFAFKGKNEDLRNIGRSLGATHLIEGSVRKAGNQLRITAQLIRANDDSHLWAQSYDRELKDVFAVQEDIAHAISASLQVPLGISRSEALVSNRSIDPQSYQAYLWAKALLRAPTATSVADATKTLENIVARNPDYARGWALLAQAYVMVPGFHPAVVSGAVKKAIPIVQTYVPKAEEAAQRAMRLDAMDSGTFTVLAGIQYVRGKFLAADELYSRALALDPDNPDALHFYSVTLADLGLVKQALPIRQRLLVLEPFVPLYTRLTAKMMWVDGQVDEPIALLKRVPEGMGAIHLAEIYASQGRYREAADLVLSRSDSYEPGVAQNAAHLLETAPVVAPAPQKLPGLGNLQFVYLSVGAASRVLDFREDSVRMNYLNPMLFASLWTPQYAAVRTTQRFKMFVRNAGMVDYWRGKSWPPQCHATTGDDFECS